MPPAQTATAKRRIPRHPPYRRISPAHAGCAVLPAPAVFIVFRKFTILIGTYPGHKRSPPTSRFPLSPAAQDSSPDQVHPHYRLTARTRKERLALRPEPDRAAWNRTRWISAGSPASRSFSKRSSGAGEAGRAERGRAAEVPPELPPLFLGVSIVHIIASATRKSKFPVLFLG